MHLETDRLLIRPWRHEDAARLLDIQSRVEVVKWLGDGEPVLMKDLDEAHRKVDRYAELSTSPPLGFWAIERVADNVPSQAVMRGLDMEDRGIVDTWYEGESACFVMTAERWTDQAKSD
ncbi:MAG: hypothetical protein JWN91_339 [Nocardioides sp.]|nr:hypothetical protein [Nocardioides sp.]